MTEREIEYVAELPVLGINVHFATNSQTVLAVVEDAFGTWRHLESRYRDASPALRVSVTVREGDEPGGIRIEHVCPDDTRILVHSAGSSGVSDPSRREASAGVTTAL